MIQIVADFKEWPAGLLIYIPEDDLGELDHTTTVQVITRALVLERRLHESLPRVKERFRKWVNEGISSGVGASNIPEKREKI